MGEPAGILNLNEAKPGVRVFTDPSGACGCDGGIFESTYSLLLLFATFDLMTCD